MKKPIIFLLFMTFACSGFSGILKKQIPERLVVLTFDDATASQYSVVAPLLKKYGFGQLFSSANLRLTSAIPPNT